VPPSSRGPVYCSFDGKDRTELRPGDALAVRLSQHPIPTVASCASDWFHSVRENLMWNVRKVQGGPVQAAG
jgi:NAD+ kinase